MSNEEKLPKQSASSPDSSKREELMLDLMARWVESLTALRHSMASIRDYLGTMDHRAETEEKEIHQILEYVDTIQLFLVSVKTHCQSSLAEFLKQRGPIGVVKWLVQETHERPRAVITLYALMATTVLILASLGLDVSQILKSVMVSAGIIP